MDPHYRHTQIGWVIILSTLLVAALIATQAELLRLQAAAGVALALVAFVLVLFTTLTVELDASEIRVRFTGGLIRRRVSLREVARFRMVRNHWLSGWGIRKVPGGWLWNVSGLDALELELKSGRVFRIGTDEPRALLAAIERVGGPADTSAVDGTSATPARAPRGPLLVLGTILVLGVLVLAVLWRLQTRPPGVSVTAERIRIDTLFYGASYPTNEILGVTLERELPRVLARSNGFAGGRALRGWFAVQGLGEGKLFVERGRPPYLVLRLRRGFAIVNFERPERTEALFAELQQVRQATP
jgi:hypothetical protein